MFEESSRVPLLVRLPGQSRARRVTGPVSQIDLVPTLLDLMGQPVPDHLQGSSLRALLADGGDRAEGDVFIEWNTDQRPGSDPKAALPDWAGGICTPEEAHAARADPIRTVVTPDGWKLNYSTIGQHELFCLAEDPLEMRNLAADSAQRPRMEDMLGRIKAWQRRTGDVTCLRQPGDEGMPNEE